MSKPSIQDETNKLFLELKGLQPCFDQHALAQLEITKDQPLDYNLSTGILLQIIRAIQQKQFPIYTSFLLQTGISLESLSDKQTIYIMFGTMRDLQSDSGNQYVPKATPEAFTDRIDRPGKEMVSVHYERVRTVRAYLKILVELQKKWIKMSSDTLRKQEGFIVLLPKKLQPQAWNVNKQWLQHPDKAVDYRKMDLQLVKCEKQEKVKPHIQTWNLDLQDYQIRKQVEEIRPNISNLIDITKKAIVGDATTAVDFNTLPKDIQERIRNQFTDEEIDEEMKNFRKGPKGGKHTQDQKKKKRNEESSDDESNPFGPDDSSSDGGKPPPRRPRGEQYKYDDNKGNYTKDDQKKDKKQDKKNDKKNQPKEEQIETSDDLMNQYLTCKRVDPKSLTEKQIMSKYGKSVDETPQNYTSVNKSDSAHEKQPKPQEQKDEVPMEYTGVNDTKVDSKAELLSKLNFTNTQINEIIKSKFEPAPNDPQLREQRLNDLIKSGQFLGNQDEKIENVMRRYGAPVDVKDEPEPMQPVKQLVPVTVQQELPKSLKVPSPQIVPVVVHQSTPKLPIEVPIALSPQVNLPPQIIPPQAFQNKDQQIQDEKYDQQPHQNSRSSDSSSQVVPVTTQVEVPRPNTQNIKEQQQLENPYYRDVMQVKTQMQQRPAQEKAQPQAENQYMRDVKQFMEQRAQPQIEQGMERDSPKIQENDYIQAVKQIQEQIKNQTFSQTIIPTIPPTQQDLAKYPYVDIKKESNVYKQPYVDLTNQLQAQVNAGKNTREHANTSYLQGLDYLKNIEMQPKLLTIQQNENPDIITQQATFNTNQQFTTMTLEARKQIDDSIQAKYKPKQLDTSQLPAVNIPIIYPSNLQVVQPSLPQIPSTISKMTVMQQPSIDSNPELQSISMAQSKSQTPKMIRDQQINQQISRDQIKAELKNIQTDEFKDAYVASDSQTIQDKSKSKFDASQPNFYNSQPQVDLSVAEQIKQDIWDHSVQTEVSEVKLKEKESALIQANLEKTQHEQMNQEAQTAQLQADMLQEQNVQVQEPQPKSILKSSVSYQAEQSQPQAKQESIHEERNDIPQEQMSPIKKEMISSSKVSNPQKESSLLSSQIQNQSQISQAHRLPFDVVKASMSVDPSIYIQQSIPMVQQNVVPIQTHIEAKPQAPFAQQQMSIEDIARQNIQMQQQQFNMLPKKQQVNIQQEKNVEIQQQQQEPMARELVVNPVNGDTFLQYQPGVNLKNIKEVSIEELQKPSNSTSSGSSGKKPAVDLNFIESQHRQLTQQQFDNLPSYSSSQKQNVTLQIGNPLPHPSKIESASRKQVSMEPQTYQTTVLSDVPRSNVTSIDSNIDSFQSERPRLRTFVPSSIIPKPQIVKKQEYGYQPLPNAYGGSYGIVSEVSKQLDNSRKLMGQMGIQPPCNNDIQYNRPKNSIVVENSSSSNNRRLNDLMDRGKQLLNQMEQISQGISEPSNLRSKPSSRSSLQSTQ